MHVESWLVQLDTRTRRRVHHWVRSYAFELNGMPTSTHLNLIPLGSYSMLLGMDSLFINMNKVDFYEKAIEFLDDDRERRILLGTKKPISVRMVITM